MIELLQRVAVVCCCRRWLLLVTVLVMAIIFFAAVISQLETDRLLLPTPLPAVTTAEPLTKSLTTVIKLIVFAVNV